MYPDVTALAMSLILFVGWATACARHARGEPSWRVRFGPVVTNELIVGRVVDGSTAWIMTGSDVLVRIDLESGSSSRAQVQPLAAGEHAWGLAGAAGQLWTLIGRSTLAHIGADGRIARRVPLTAPHVGLFGGGAELLYQVMSFQPPAEALTIGPPGDGGQRPWGRMRTRALPLARTAVAALNLVSCGPTASETTPCWFPDQPAITLTDPTGQSREIVLEGLPGDAPEVLLASDHPQRPIRDAFVARSGAVWVLGSGVPPADSSARRGGWLLGRYDGEGRLERRMPLPEPARLLVAAWADRCLLVAWDGRVVEVQP